MFGYTHTTGNIHLTTIDIIPCAHYFSQQSSITGYPIQTQEAHEIHVEGMRMYIWLQLVHSKGTIGYGIQAGECIPSTPTVDIAHYPLTPLQVLLLTGNLV